MSFQLYQCDNQLDAKLSQILESLAEEPTAPFSSNIEQDTLDNGNYRKVIYTATNIQLVLMSIKDEIGEETHSDTDQFIRIESGTGLAIIDGKEFQLRDGSAIIIPSGSKHNIINKSEEPLKLYTIYSPPHHPEDIVQNDKPND